MHDTSATREVWITAFGVLVEYVLFALRMLMALLLLSFLAALLFVLLREPNQNATSQNNAPPHPAKLIALSTDPDNPRTIELTRNAWLGRDPNSLVYLEDARVSARHAQMVWDNSAGDSGAWFIEDNASRNGTLVNGVRVARHILAEEDVIEVGEARFKFAFQTRISTNQASQTNLHE